VCIDSQSVDGDVVLEEKGVDGNKKIKGRKRHIVTDVMGLIILCMLLDLQMNQIDIKDNGLSISCKVFWELKKLLLIANTKAFLERIFSWLKRQKRLAGDYEVDPHHGRSMVFIGMFKIILNRLA
jgi:putative transposase